MKKVQFTVEKNKDGYWSYRQEPEGLISSYGKTLAELKKESVSAYNLFVDGTKKPAITEGQVQLSFELGAFFGLYKEINASGISKRSGVNNALLSDYINGKRKPSEKQVAKIYMAIKDLGREITEMDLV